jgi:hypothetical protein
VREIEQGFHPRQEGLEFRPPGALRRDADLGDAAARHDPADIAGRQAPIEKGVQQPFVEAGDAGELGLEPDEETAIAAETESLGHRRFRAVAAEEPTGPDRAARRFQRDALGGLRARLHRRAVAYLGAGVLGPLRQPAQQ